MSKKSLLIDPQLSGLLVDPLFMIREELTELLVKSHFTDTAAFYLVDNPPTYKDETIKLAGDITAEEISVTADFTETDIPDNSIALHRIKGPIIADYSYWYFSTKQFVEDIRAADRNPQIIAHLLFINSGGGEAWYLEKALKALLELNKPVVTFVEKRCASAAYYIGCGARRMFSTSVNDTVGSIGTMIAFLDLIPYFEKLGAKWIEEYANQSKLKNKRFNDLLDGKPKEFKKRELDPLAAQFISAVRGARPALAALPEDHDIFAGDSYNAEEGRSNGLIDEIADLEIALQYTYQQGLVWKDKAEKQSRVQTYID